MTPLIAELHNAHKERLARFARAAITEPQPIKRPKIALRIEKPKPVKKQDKRTVEIRETKREPWFCIIDEVSPLESLQDKTFAIQRIQRTTSRYFDVPVASLFSKRRTLAVVIPRQIAMYLCKTHTLRTLPEIGRQFGGFDHTSVLHNVRITEKRMRANWVLAFDIAHIEGMLS